MAHNRTFAVRPGRCDISVIGTVTALTSFHLRWLDVDPYQTF